jgi:ribosomal protein L19E
MKENNESLVFKKKISKLKEDLEALRRQELIDNQTYMDFFFLTTNATTFDQLDQLSQDLTEISRSKMPPR